MRLTFVRFLLAKLQLDFVLKEEGTYSRKQALQNLPNSPDEAYDLIVARICEAGSHSKLIAFRALSWIFYAKRPLTFRELREAIFLKPGQKDLDPACSDFHPTELVRACKSLVLHEEGSGVVRFVHETVQAYIAMRIKLDTELVKNSNFLSQVDIAMDCLTYFGFNVFDGHPVAVEIVQKYQLSQYLFKYWNDHTRGIAEKSSDVVEAVLSLLASEEETENDEGNHNCVERRLLHRRRPSR